jgi:outer membrane protein assembly factor BamB
MLKSLGKYGVIFVILVLLILIIPLIYGIFNLKQLDITEPRDNQRSQPVTSHQWRSMTRGDPVSEPLVMFRNDAARSGYFDANDAPETNQTLWTFNTTNSNTGNAVYSTAAIMNDKVYIGSGEGKLYCLNLSNGAHNWNYSTIPGAWSHGMSCSPAVSDGKVFIGNDFRPFLWCINATSGAKIWEFNTGGGGMKGIYSSPAVDGGRVYFGDENNSLYCLPEDDPNSNGIINLTEVIWQFNAPDKIWSSPAVYGNNIYVGCGGANSAGTNKFYCLNANNGTINWTYPAVGNIQDVPSSPAVVNNRVYFGSTDNNVYTLYANNGTLIWSFPTGNDVISSPAVAYGRVFIGSDDDKLYCLNATTGAKVWDYTTGDNIWASPSVADDKVYVGSGDGKVYCLNATANTAKKIWEYEVSTKLYGICSTPAIADGKVVIGGATGGNSPDESQVLCFADLDLTPPTIIETYPADQTTDVPTTVTIEINFSEPMDVSTISSSNILLKDSSENPISGTVNYYSATTSTTFEPTIALARGETYTVSVLSSVKDEVGLGLDGNNNGLVDGSPLDDYTWEFTTSINNPPGLTNGNVTPLEGNLDTDFEYRVVYTDLDNDTPIINPAFIKVYIDNEITGRSMVLDPGTQKIWRDGNFTNGECYVHTTTLSIYGEHTYQFKCADGLDTNSTQVFNDPFLWDPQEFGAIPNQKAVEDIDLVLDLSDKINDEDTSKSNLVLTENSSYATVNDFNITFNYPNSFNYPSGRTFELVKITLNDSIMAYEVSKTIRVDVEAVNDPPVLLEVPDFVIHEDEPYLFNLTPYLRDEDNEISELEISTNSSYITVNGQNIIFLYPVESKMITDYVKIIVSDGELTDYQNITVTITRIDFPPYTMIPIPDQNAIEDIDLELDMADYIVVYGVSITDISLQINSNYGTIQGTKLIFNYPNSFNYPSGRLFESVQVNVSADNYTIYQTFKIIVEPVNDEPLLTVDKAPEMALENTDFTLKVTYSDIDGGETPVVQLILDDEPFDMGYVSGDIHYQGGNYELDLNLPAGKYQYYFQGDDLEGANNSVYTTDLYELEVIKYTEAGDDTDNDGVPDAWELKYGLDPLDPSDAAEDSDGDKYPNLQEYYGLDGKVDGNDSTNPRNESDIPVLREPGDDDKDGGGLDNSMVIWIIAVIIIVIVIVLLLLFLFFKRRQGDASEVKDIDSEDRIEQQTLQENTPMPPQTSSEAEENTQWEFEQEA